MCGAAISRLGLTPGDFYGLTPVEFELAMSETNKRHELEYRTKFEAARLIAVHIWNSAGKTLKHGEFDPTKLVPMPWDRPEVPKVQTADEIKDALKLWAIAFNGKPENEDK